MKISALLCDNCGKEESALSSLAWFHLQKISESYDFCSLECLGKFFFHSTGTTDDPVKPVKLKCGLNPKDT